LSITHDIVKAHGGEIIIECLYAEIKSQEGRPAASPDHTEGHDPVGKGTGTVFIIKLPIK
ncbi:MAG: sensor histidine kinase, partial [Mongoliibacter sp.]|uniref:hypothetical protein n=1 Tax=Mongoliibacter sp. TaxID=2022438 RepID=UPI0012F33542